VHFRGIHKAAGHFGVIAFHLLLAWRRTYRPRCPYLYVKLSDERDQSPCRYVSHVISASQSYLLQTTIIVDMQDSA